MIARSLSPRFRPDVHSAPQRAPLAFLGTGWSGILRESPRTAHGAGSLSHSAASGHPRAQERPAHNLEGTAMSEKNAAGETEWVDPGDAPKLTDEHFNRA